MTTTNPGKGSRVHKPRVVAKRPTEGARVGPVARGQAPRGKGGRPKGSKNKPKGLIPLPVAEDLILSLQPVLPPEQIRYLRSVIKDGAALDTRKELDTLIMLLNRSIWPALVSEAVPYSTDSIGAVVTDEDPDETDDTDDAPTKESRPSTTILRRDVTDRLKVLTSLLNLSHSLDKGEKAQEDETQPVLKLFADRGVDTRIAILLTSQKQDGPKQLPSGEEVIVAA
jgi:hypothetical protein